MHGYPSFLFLEIIEPSEYALFATFDDVKLIKMHGARDPQFVLVILTAYNKFFNAYTVLCK